eukprot:TRINITY_DN8261_c0_g1_i1.p1 TRINITY_DN8261_c0_g1~~TRINITY_DN8261_c0_g1_i1.p1  ORF type:complete len:790 (+),score=183.55 TRINITY_DN8261_c0_g1_i1:299-2371(+)
MAFSMRDYFLGIPKADVFLPTKYPPAEYLKAGYSVVYALSWPLLFLFHVAVYASLFFHAWKGQAKSESPFLPIFFAVMAGATLIITFRIPRFWSWIFFQCFFVVSFLLVTYSSIIRNIFHQNFSFKKYSNKVSPRVRADDGVQSFDYIAYFSAKIKEDFQQVEKYLLNFECQVDPYGGQFPRVQAVFPAKSELFLWFAVPGFFLIAYLFFLFPSIIFGLYLDTVAVNIQISKILSAPLLFVLFFRSLLAMKASETTEKISSLFHNLSVFWLIVRAQETFLLEQLQLVKVSGEAMSLLLSNPKLRESVHHEKEKKPEQTLRQLLDEIGPGLLSYYLSVKHQLPVVADATWKLQWRKVTDQDKDQKITRYETSRLFQIFSDILRHDDSSEVVQNTPTATVSTQSKASQTSSTNPLLPAQKSTQSSQRVERINVAPPQVPPLLFQPTLPLADFSQLDVLRQLEHFRMILEVQHFHNDIQLQSIHKLRRTQLSQQLVLDRIERNLFGSTPVLDLGREQAPAIRSFPQIKPPPKGIQSPLSAPGLLRMLQHIEDVLKIEHTLQIEQLESIHQIRCDQVKQTAQLERIEDSIPSDQITPVDPPAIGASGPIMHESTSPTPHFSDSTSIVEKPTPIDDYTSLLLRDLLLEIEIEKIVWDFGGLPAAPELLGQSAGERAVLFSSTSDWLLNSSTKIWE